MGQTCAISRLLTVVPQSADDELWHIKPSVHTSLVLRSLCAIDTILKSNYQPAPTPPSSVVFLLSYKKWLVRAFGLPSFFLFLLLFFKKEKKKRKTKNPDVLMLTECRLFLRIFAHEHTRNWWIQEITLSLEIREINSVVPTLPSISPPLPLPFPLSCRWHVYYWSQSGTRMLLQCLDNCPATEPGQRDTVCIM